MSVMPVWSYFTEGELRLWTQRYLSKGEAERVSRKSRGNQDLGGSLVPHPPPESPGRQLPSARLPSFHL